MPRDFAAPRTRRAKSPDMTLSEWAMDLARSVMGSRASIRTMETPWPPQTFALDARRY